MKYMDADDAVARISSGQRVYLHGGGATPQSLVEALMRRAGDLADAEIVHLHSDAAAPYAAPGMARAFRHNALFIGPNVRPQPVKEFLFFPWIGRSYTRCIRE